jgi:uncharacterized UBP type Zn finger protein
MASGCEHLEAAARRTKGVTPSGPGCAECLTNGSSWVHLRLCLSCGHVGCCDDSPNRHATAHFRATQHPVIRSYEPGEAWGWCYADEEGVRSLPAFPGESPSRHYSAPRGGASPPA